ncbi:MAG: enoyl-CoA hydratase/isomerase family protein [Planctomycetota bacterium]
MIRVETNELRINNTPARFGELILDRPDKRNALTVTMLDHLERAARALNDDECLGAILLRGDGPSFCAGFDLTPVNEQPDALAPLLEGLSAVVRTLRTAHKPVIVAVQGHAIAGGCALLGGADFVVSHPTAKLGYPVVRLGISPALTAPLLRPAIGPARARTMLLAGDLITGEHAASLSLVHRLVDLPEDVTPRAQIEAAALAAKPPHAIRTTKALLNTLDGLDDDNDPLNTALAASLRIVGNPHQQHALAALFNHHT